MSTPIRKALISGFGDPSNISIITSEISGPAKNEVQVKPLYAGLGGSDINMRLGTYPMQKSFPLTPGYCLIGRVQLNGPDSSKFKKNDLVACLTVYDAQSELVNLPEKYLIPVPGGVDLIQGVPLILDWSTAYGMVFRTAKVSKGQRVFVHGLSGSVGYAIFKLCELQGAQVYGTASASNHAALREAGAIPFEYKNKKWIEEMKAIGGAHAVFDPLGFESWDESWSINAKEGGHVIGYGGNARTLNPDEEHGSQALAVTKLLSRNLVPFCPHKTSFYYVTRDQKTFEPELKALFELLRDGKITVPIKKVWTLEEVPEAHRTWASASGPSGFGSTVVKVTEDNVA